MILEHLWCKACQRNTVHLSQGMNHVAHILGVVLTGGVWLIFWFLIAVFRDRPTYCVHCSEAFTPLASRTVPYRLGRWVGRLRQGRTAP